ncbi:Transcriptional regulator, TetR family [Labilithrix luteola]|uniref:Transcriptional regulator, TetR family n=1 Tax=Labilithrix luteola TaxID=1391654 RepID=A0A0K1QE17_9BACT|nr:TetR/AcrR family transcriptional regulator [Labilithrix luteola]AKV04004.1 Transcriptional regulator, TetR family [Labilithrix luteola]
MARYPAGHKEEVRQRIVDEAAAAYRERGLEGIGIQSLMRRLGLTHGGFYVHFPDREALVVAALARAGEQAVPRFRSDARGNAVSFTEFTKRYLSPDHRDHPGEGCTIATLAPEASRQSSTIQGAIASATNKFLENVGRTLDEDNDAERPLRLTDRAIAVGCVLIGSLVLARALGDTPNSARVLAVGRRIARSLQSEEIQ